MLVLMLSLSFYSHYGSLVILSYSLSHWQIVTSDKWRLIGRKGRGCKTFPKILTRKISLDSQIVKGLGGGVDLLNIDKCFYFVRKHWEIKKTNINLKEKRKSSECLLLLTIFDDYFIDFYWLFNFSFRHIQMKCLSFPLFIFFGGGIVLVVYVCIYIFILTL